ncbi:MAG: hypothetical protein GX201_06105 [Clostridiales bacterium]|nr:hypothetical protein [Clostridiales bacterium]
MRNFIVLLLCSMVLFSSCSIKENQLVIINDSDNSKNKPSAKLKDWQIETVSQKALIEKNKQVIEKIDKDIVPLAISPDYETVICYKSIKDDNADTINNMIIAGNMVQKMELFIYNTTNGAYKSLGQFMSIKSFQFDQEGKQWAFIDGDNNVYIYNLENERLNKVIEKHNYRDFNTICWSRDSKRLMFDNRMIFDIASKEFVSIAADSYTPFIRMEFSNNTFITEMKNNKYENIIALYNFDNKTYTQIADGYYKDSDNTNLLYTMDLMQGLKIVNLKTLESKTIEEGPVYCANLLKSTGEIIYTTLNSSFDDEIYLLVKINPETMVKQVFPLCTPTFYLSPAEDKLYFITNYSENSIIIDLETYRVDKIINKTDDEDLREIKSVVLKMFLLDYNFQGNFEEYEVEAKKIYTNTDCPVPQEALNNKLTDFKRFNTPLPSFQKEEYIPPDLKLYSINIKNNRASINIGRFFVNSIELIKIDNKWYITGFSTHPESKEVAQIRSIVQKHINDIMSGNKKEALKYWDEKEDSEHIENNRNIIENLINNKDKLVIEVGETELWAMSEPHRAESPSSATEARTKIIIKDGKNIIKYKIVLSRIYWDEFIIKTWDTDPLSVSQLY